jgi:hypothetical protein
MLRLCCPDGNPHPLLDLQSLKAVLVAPIVAGLPGEPGC